MVGVYFSDGPIVVAKAEEGVFSVQAEESKALGVSGEFGADCGDSGEPDEPDEPDEADELNEFRALVA